ncbi:hypothetical protein [Paractinoplanes toevensis]|uniref:Uncharacterized protein n=1 Tax=Paractinoplanes toevensis TaxID=571911 RepID=A0A919T7D5_9ACTN|nr:hypothetical protein [Actinoplanes toevensis]GIM90052.1 hypothetical protein Ato02nite_018450 [Actinoplanes toevensis]
MTPTRTPFDPELGTLLAGLPRVPELDRELLAQIDIPLEWLDRFRTVVVTVEYRLAPENTGTSAEWPSRVLLGTGLEAKQGVRR